MPRFPLSFQVAVLMASTTLLLSACSSIVDSPNQQVQILTPGATGARCAIENDNVRYLAHPPEMVFMHRARDALTITCEAPGNRSKTAVIYPKINSSSTGNLATGGLSGVYDYFSGALYEYPSPVTVDFRQTKATPRPLPDYHAPDTLSPFDQTPEDMRDRPTLLPGESNLAPDPALLKEKDDKDETSSDEDATTDGTKNSDTAAPADAAEPAENGGSDGATDVGS